MQIVLICIQTGHTVDDEQTLEFATEEFYVKSRVRRWPTLFADVPEAHRKHRKDRRALQCGVRVRAYQAAFVQCTRTARITTAYFRRTVLRGPAAPATAKTRPRNTVDRLEYELGVISQHGLCGLLPHRLTTFIHYAKSHGIPVGPGRGSGAGSIAAYCIGITGIDPMRYNLLFERFLNPERVSMPDFDMDFCYERRQEVIDYVVRKYGADHVAQIITFGTMAGPGRHAGRGPGPGHAPIRQVDASRQAGAQRAAHDPGQGAGGHPPSCRSCYEADPQVHGADGHGPQGGGDAPPCLHPCGRRGHHPGSGGQLCAPGQRTTSPSSPSSP